MDLIFLFSSDGKFIAAGSDDGKFFVWNKDSGNLVRIFNADETIVNCLQCHPNICLLASSGIEPVVRLWSPFSEVKPLTALQSFKIIATMGKFSKYYNYLPVTNF